MMRLTHQFIPNPVLRGLQKTAPSRVGRSGQSPPARANRENGLETTGLVIRGRFGNSPTTGFTLLESLMVVLIIGILAAIGVPSWLNFLNNLRLNTAQNEVYGVLLNAKTKATHQKITYQASFRELGDLAQWAVHPASVTPTEEHWQNLNSFVTIDPSKTTLYQYSTSGVWRMQFNYRGNSNGRLGRVTVRLRNSNSNQQRCVFVSTLLGAMRKTDQCG